MKALFPTGKMTPHMNVVAIPIVHNKKKDCMKISISELWKFHTAGMPLDMVRDILGEVDERTTLRYIYNPKTEEENREIMNHALGKKVSGSKHDV